ncbi:MAG TPA: thiol:disulfide interchange protein DsbA/DsbL [Steroidobacteraceae bacterium]|nr:thiol:disulfide interchange protein DsbA/DsbL [Steroidobacteraceae bacterium]
MNIQRALSFSLLAALATLRAEAAPAWVEGRDYAVLNQAQQTSVPAGKVEVLEVFSYGCPACNRFQPIMALLKKGLPPTAQLAYLPAAFNTAEDWPMFQRAYFAAQALGIAERTHQLMYDAVWKTGELATTDSATKRLKSPQPTIEQAAQAYTRWSGVKAADFLATARSFSVEVRMRGADAQVLAMQVPGTPTLVVDGRYRVAENIIDEILRGGSPDQLIPLVRFLVEKARAH